MITATDMKARLKSLAEELSRRQIDRIYLTGCGGGIANLRPCEHVLLRKLDEGKTRAIYAAELMAENPKGLNANALVVVASFNGTMKEAVDVMRWAKGKGAYVVGITYVPGTPIATESDFPILCEFIDTDQAALAPMPTCTLLGYTIVKAMTGQDETEHVWQALLNLDKAYRRADECYIEKRGKEFLTRFQNAPMIYTMSSGLNFVNAYVLATCYLLEMQWMNASPINASEFFHGALEIIDKDSKFIMLLGKGEARAIDERARAFLDRFTRGSFVVDAADFDIEEEDSILEEVLCTLVTAHLIRNLGRLLADARYHPLTTRRYYLKFDY